MFEEVEGSAEDQLLAVGMSLLRLLLSPEVRSVEAILMADKTNQASLTRLCYEAGPARFRNQIGALLRQVHAKKVLNVRDSAQAARLFAALFKGYDLLIIVPFSQPASDDEIDSYCRSAVQKLRALGPAHLRRALHSNSPLPPSRSSNLSCLADRR